MKRHKGGKYSDRSAELRKKKIKRKVISYEDVPLEEYEDERTKISKSAVKRIVLFAGLILLLGLVVFAIANRDNLTPERISRWITYDLLGSRDTGYPVDIVGSNVEKGNFAYEGNIQYVSDTSFVALASNGNELAYKQLTFARPILASAGDNVIIYNLGGTGYITGNKKELRNVREDENDIFTADINSKGYYCITTKVDGYLSKITVYNKDNEKVYAYSFADYYINAVALNNDGTGCVACGFSGSDGSLSSIAYVLDFSKEEPLSTYSLDENPIYSVEYLDNNNVCMVGSDASYTLEISSGKLSQIDYNQMKLTAFDINKDTGNFVLSLSRSGDGRKCSLEYINRFGEVIGVNDTERKIDSVSLYKNRIGVLDNNKCYIYDTDGNKISKAKTGNGSKAIRLESPDSAYVLGINEIRKIIDFK